MAAKDLLSKDEINALLHSVQDGAISAQEPSQSQRGVAYPYDVSCQQAKMPTVPILDNVHESLTRQLSAPLSDLLGCPVAVSAASRRTLRFEEYANSLPAPASFNRVNIKPLNLSCLIALDAGLVSGIVNQLFGGDSRFQIELNRQELTPTEQRLVERVVRELLHQLRYVWAPYLALDFEFVKAEAHSQSLPTIAADNTVLATALNIQLQDHTGQIHIVLPREALVTLSELLESPASMKAKRKDDLAWETSLRSALDDVLLEMKCTIVETEISLRQVMRLKAGDVIPVDIPENATLYVKAMPAFNGKFGVSRGSYAVKILQSRRSQAVKQIEEAP